MGIITRRGDKGFTFLFQKKLRKDDKRIEAIGTVDELSSFLGVAKSLLSEEKKELIENIQKDLLIIGEALAKEHLTKEKISFIKERINWLGKEIEDRERKLKINKFVLPGENFLSAWFNIVRAITRRLERKVVALRKKNEYILIYLNRLSDFLFLYAQEFQNSKDGKVGI